MRALVLAAGGVTGALYEVGVLRAVEERVGPPGELFDIFLGASAGATVAAFVAQGVLPSKLYDALLDGRHPLFPLRQEDLAVLDLRQGARLAAMAFQQMVRGFGSLLPRGRRKADAAPVPPGLFSTDRYRRFLASTLASNGLSNEFRGLPRRLLVPATDLDSTRRVVFGKHPWMDVPISTAVAASSAIPAFFEPVVIGDRRYLDGDVGDVANLDVLVQEGTSRALVVSPMVPVENETGSCVVPGEGRSCRSLAERGPWAVYNQALRIEHQVRLHQEIARHLSENQELEVALIEPEPSNATLFLANPLSLAARREVLESAYSQASRTLCRAETGGWICAGHGSEVVDAALSGPWLPPATGSA